MQNLDFELMDGTDFEIFRAAELCGDISIHLKLQYIRRCTIDCVGD